MEINIDLEKQIADAVVAAIAPEKIGELIQKNVSSVVEEAVKSAFGYNSAFKKLVEASISQLFPHELNLGKQSDWNHYIQNAINERVAVFNDQRMKEAIAPLLDNLLETPPKSIKLSDLLKSIVSHWRKNDDFHGDPWMEIDVSTGITNDHKHIYIAKKTPYSKYSSDIQLRTMDNSVWGVSVGEQPIEKIKFAGPFFNLEQKLFQLYACKTKIEFDVEDIIDVDFDDCETGGDDD